MKLEMMGTYPNKNLLEEYFSWYEVFEVSISCFMTGPLIYKIKTLSSTSTMATYQGKSVEEAIDRLKEYYLNPRLDICTKYAIPYNSIRGLTLEQIKDKVKHFIDV